MKVELGIDQFIKSKQGKIVSLNWDTEQLINPHILIMGMSGVGKTHTLRKFVNNLIYHAEKNGMTTEDFRINIFDIHGDIKAYKESNLLYSESTGYGINPLALSDDPHFGGVRKKIEQFIRTLETSTRKVGEKQANIIRKTLDELYQKFGFYTDNPHTWSLESNTIDHSIVWLDVGFHNKDEAKKAGARWNPTVSCWYIDAEKCTPELQAKFPVKPLADLPQKRYPNLVDYQKYLKAKMEEAFIGSTKKVALALLALHKKNNRLNKLKIKEANTPLSDQETKAYENLIKSIERLKAEITEHTAEYLSYSPEGKELESLLKYRSYEDIASIYNRIENMVATGIFKDEHPPFDYSQYTHRHIIKPLNAQEQKMFVLFSAEKIFEECVRKGETKEIREVIVIDEASNFFDDSEDGILNKIALEGRKFGCMLICASQAPHHFTQDFLGTVATKMVLGIDETYWATAKRKLNLDKKKLQWIAPRQTMLVQMKGVGGSHFPWKTVEIKQKVKKVSEL